MAAFLERAAHSVYRMFSLYFDVIIPIAFRYELHFPIIPICIAKFTIGILGDETGHVHEMCEAL